MGVSFGEIWSTNDKIYDRSFDPTSGHNAGHCHAFWFRFGSCVPSELTRAHSLHPAPKSDRNQALQLNRANDMATESITGSNNQSFAKLINLFAQ